MEEFTPQEIKQRKAQALEVQTKVKNGEAQLLDVREKEEWKDGHLKLAKLVTLSSLQEGEEPTDDMDRDKLTYLHCRSGNRVHTAMPILQSMGFENLVCLPQGFDELVSYGMESE